MHKHQIYKHPVNVLLATELALKQGGEEAGVGEVFKTTSGYSKKIF